MLKKIIILISLAVFSLQCNEGCSGDKAQESDSSAIGNETKPAAEITEENAQSEAEKILKELKNM